MDANKSFYQYWLFLSGISFGIGELNYLKHGSLADMRVIFPVIISVGFLVALFIKKKRLEHAGEEAIILNRRHRHISADYLCIVGTTSLFSMLAYVVMNDIDLTEGWHLTPFAVALLINILIFGSGMTLLQSVAGDERRGATP